MADFKTFGRELANLNLGNAFRSLAAPGVLKHESGGAILEPQAYRNGMFMFGNGSLTKFFEYDDIESALNAFVKCPPLQSVLLRKADAAITGKLWVMTESGKGRNRESKTEWANKTRAKLNRPNPFESGREWLAKIQIYTDLFGWCIIYPTYSSTTYARKGFAEADSIWVLPPYMLDWQETGNVFNQTDLKGVFRHIKMQVHGYMLDLPLDQILLVRGKLPRMLSGSMSSTMCEAMILPDTKVRSLQQPINNIIGAYASRGELISYAGAQNIISPQPGSGGMVAMPLTPQEEKELQDKFKLQYGVMQKQYRNIISSQPLNVQKMGTPTKDLMLFEEVVEDVKAICDQYGYQYRLLSNGSASSLNGTEVNALQRDLYQNTIIPESQSLWEQLAIGFKAEENKCRFEADFSHLPVLQADGLQSAQTRQTMGAACFQDFKNGFITYNRALELMGEDTVTGGDIYYKDWIKQNQVENESDQPGATGNEAQNGNEGGEESEAETGPAT